MSHELEFVNGEASLAYVGPRSEVWHHCGVSDFPENATPQEIMKAAQLDWKVEKKSAFVEINGQNIKTGMSGLVRDRDNKLLSMVSDDWQPLQNSDAFEFFAEFVEKGDMKMDVAGSLRGGKIVWALARVGDDLNLFGGDKIKNYVLLSSPHEYGRTIDVRDVNTRVICANTLAFAMSEGMNRQVKVNHRKAFDADQVKVMMGLHDKHVEEFKTIATVLGDIRYTMDSSKEFFKKIFPISSSDNDNEGLSMNAKRALDIVESQPGAEYRPGTFWNLFNAVTFMTSNVMSRDADTRMYNNMYGSNRQLGVKALHTAMEMAQAA